MEFVSKSALDNQPKEHICFGHPVQWRLLSQMLHSQLLSLKVPTADDWRVAVLNAMITTVGGDVSWWKVTV